MSYEPHQLQAQFDKTIAHVETDMASLRTGKASVQLLDPVKVEAYGSMMALNEVASVTAPDANLLLVSPWDKSLMAVVEKAIASSGLNLNPVVDQSVIRIVVPPLTAERRQDMVKLLHQKIESGRVAIRAVRTEARKDIDDLDGQAGVSEDDLKQYQKELDEMTQKSLSKLDDLQTAKEKELLTL